MARRGNSLKDGFVAMDHFEFIGSESCQFTPQEADPNYQPSTTPSTPIPTEPPNCKFYHKYTLGQNEFWERFHIFILTLTFLQFIDFRFNFSFSNFQF